MMRIIIIINNVILILCWLLLLTPSTIMMYLPIIGLPIYYISIVFIICNILISLPLIVLKSKISIFTLCLNPLFIFLVLALINGIVLETDGKLDEYMEIKFDEHRTVAEKNKNFDYKIDNYQKINSIELSNEIPVTIGGILYKQLKLPILNLFRIESDVNINKQLSDNKVITEIISQHDTISDYIENDSIITFSLNNKIKVINKTPYDNINLLYNDTTTVKRNVLVNGKHYPMIYLTIGVVEKSDVYSNYNQIDDSTFCLDRNIIIYCLNIEHPTEFFLFSYNSENDTILRTKFLTMKEWEKLRDKYEEEYYN